MSSYLADRRKELGLTQKDIAEAVGVSEATVSRWESGEIANMRRDRISALAKILHCSTDFVMTGQASTETTIPSGFSPMPPMNQVPLIGRIACGVPITAEENQEGIVSVPSTWHATFALVCEGDSMAPRIQNGDLVAIRKQDTVDNGQIAAVRINNEATLKKVYRYPDRLELRPINTDFEIIVLYGDDINTASIEGLAVGLCRGI